MPGVRRQVRACAALDPLTSSVVCFSPLDRGGSNRAEFRMNVSSDAT